MRRSGYALCLAALAFATPAAPQSQAASDLMLRLEKYCVATAVRPAAALDAARRDGMVRPPEVLLKQVTSEIPPEMSDVQVLWSVFEGGAYMVMTARASDAESGIKGDVCGVMSIPPNPALQQQFAAWLGLPAVANEEINVFRMSGGKRRIVKRENAGEMVRAIRDNDLFAGGVMNDEEVSVLMLVKIEV